MIRDQVFMYSPLSKESANTKRARSLLLQFILRELIHAEEGALLYVKRGSFFPNDWAQEVGCLNRLEEHVQLLTSAFPELAEEGTLLENTVAKLVREWDQKFLKKIYAALLPFLELCKDDENLLFFLLRHQHTLSKISAKKSLQEFIPADKEQFLAEAFAARGFAARAEESKALLKSLHE